FGMPGSSSPSLPTAAIPSFVVGRVVTLSARGDPRSPEGKASPASHSYGLEGSRSFSLRARAAALVHRGDVVSQRAQPHVGTQGVDLGGILQRKRLAPFAAAGQLRAITLNARELEQQAVGQSGEI